MTPKEKQLTIELLEAKIERLSGKKITYVENTKKAALIKSLNEMVDNKEVSKEDLEEIFGGAMQKIGQFMGTKWDQTKAETAFNQSYAKNIAVIAQKLGTDEATAKAALIKFMMDNGGAAILSGNGQNAQWDAASKSFKRKASTLGGPGSNVMGEAEQLNEKKEQSADYTKGYHAGHSDGKAGKENKFKAKK